MNSFATQFKKYFLSFLMPEWQTCLPAGRIGRARKREKYLKSGVGKEFLKNLNK